MKRTPPLWLGLVMGMWLGLAHGLLAKPAWPPSTTVVRFADSDADGVADAQDLCPGTPAGVAVNTYGCPLTTAACDYTTSAVTLVSTGGSSGTSVSTKYVLTNNVGTILQISPTASFSGLSGTATYMAVALTADGAVSNQAVGQSLSAVSASCYKWSDALVFKACVSAPPPPPAPDADGDGVPDAQDLCPGTPTGTPVNAYGCPLTVAQCDYSTSTVTLVSAGGSSGTSVSTKYVLTNNVGTILQISPTASFSGLSGTATYMALAIVADGAVSNLAVGQSLSSVSASCYKWSTALVFKACVTPTTPDTDGDGVPDNRDLCPGTPAGTPVNAYGCPLTVAQCDYTTSAVTLVSTGGSSGTSVSTKYVLTNNVGTILQISPTASFSGLSGTATYMAVALTADGAVSNQAVGQSLSAVSASCYAWSTALVFKACVTSTTACDYQVGQLITLQTAGGSSGAGIKTSYVLTNATGKLMVVSATPTFMTLGLAAGTYNAYALTYTDNSSITNLVANGVNALAQVTASCLAQSPAQLLLLCSNCAAKCIPITVVKIR